MTPTSSRAAPAVPRVAWVLGFVSMFTDIGTEMVFAVLPLFLVGQLGVAVATIGVIEGIAEATAALLKLGSGALADRTRRPKALAVAGYGLSALTKPLFAIATGVGLVVAARWLDRVGKGIRSTPRDVLLAAATPEGRRGRAFGLRQSFDKLGESLGPLAAFGLLALWPGNFRLVLILACFPGLLAIALLALGVREMETSPGPRNPPPNVPPERGEGHLLARATSGQPAMEKEKLRAGGKTLPRVADLRRLGPEFLRPLGAATLLGLAGFSDAFLLLRARDVGMRVELIPLVLLAMNLTASAAAYMGGVVADSRGHRLALGTGVALYAAGCALLALATAPAGVWAGAGALGLHLAFVRGNLLAWASDAAPASDRGVALGWIHLVQGLALLPASLMAGLLWQHAGPSVTFAVAAACAALALPLLRGR
jgi:MFS family permease